MWWKRWKVFYAAICLFTLSARSLSSLLCLYRTRLYEHIPTINVINWNIQNFLSSTQGSTLQLQIENKPPCDKTNNLAVPPANTHISLGIRPVWSESLLCTQWVAKELSFLHADSEDSDQTGRMPRLIWVFAGRTCYFVGFVTRRLKLKATGKVDLVQVVISFENFRTSLWCVHKA